MLQPFEKQEVNGNERLRLNPDFATSDLADKAIIMLDDSHARALPPWNLTGFTVTPLVLLRFRPACQCI